LRGWATTSRKRIFSSSLGSARWACSRPVVLRQRLPGLDRNLAVGLRRQHQDDFGASMSVSMRGQPLGRPRGRDDAVELPSSSTSCRCSRRCPCRRCRACRHQRPERREALVEVGIVALDHGDLPAWSCRGSGSHSPFFQSLTSNGCAISPGLSCWIGVSTTSFSTPSTSGATSRERLGDRLVDLPVAARLPGRVHRRRERVDEGVHVGGVEVVLLVPGGRRQHDVGVDAGRRHAEVERDQQVELSFRRLVVPDDLLAACALPSSPRSLPITPCEVPSRCFRKYSCPLPEEPSRLERQTNMLRGQLAGSSGSSQDSFSSPTSASRRRSPSARRRPPRPPWPPQRIGLELRRGRQPAHALGADVVVDDRAVPGARRRGRRQDSRRRQTSRSATGRCGHRRTRSSSAAAAGGPSRGEGERRQPVCGRSFSWPT
jgi:hypothetical protein